MVKFLETRVKGRSSLWGVGVKPIRRRQSRSKNGRKAPQKATVGCAPREALIPSGKDGIMKFGYAE